MTFNETVIEAVSKEVIDAQLDFQSCVRRLKNVRKLLTRPREQEAFNKLLVDFIRQLTDV